MKKNIAWAAQVAIGVWKSLGYNAIIYLSAITSIDPGAIPSSRGGWC